MKNTIKKFTTLLLLAVGITAGPSLFASGISEQGWNTYEIETGVTISVKVTPYYGYLKTELVFKGSTVSNPVLFIGSVDDLADKGNWIKDKKVRIEPYSFEETLDEKSFEKTQLKFGKSSFMGNPLTYNGDFKKDQSNNFSTVFYVPFLQPEEEAFVLRVVSGGKEVKICSTIQTEFFDGQAELFHDYYVRKNSELFDEIEPGLPSFLKDAIASYDLNDQDAKIDNLRASNFYRKIVLNKFFEAGCYSLLFDNYDKDAAYNQMKPALSRITNLVNPLTGEMSAIIATYIMTNFSDNLNWKNTVKDLNLHNDVYEFQRILKGEIKTLDWGGDLEEVRNISRNQLINNPSFDLYSFIYHLKRSFISHFSFSPGLDSSGGVIVKNFEILSQAPFLRKDWSQNASLFIRIYLLDKTRKNVPVSGPLASEKLGDFNYNPYAFSEITADEGKKIAKEASNFLFGFYRFNKSETVDFSSIGSTNEIERPKLGKDKYLSVKLLNPADNVTELAVFKGRNLFANTDKDNEFIDPVKFAYVVLRKRNSTTFPGKITFIGYENVATDGGFKLVRILSSKKSDFEASLLTGSTDQSSDFKVYVVDEPTVFKKAEFSSYLIKNFEIMAFSDSPLLGTANSVYQGKNAIKLMSKINNGISSEFGKSAQQVSLKDNSSVDLLVEVVGSDYRVLPTIIDTEMTNFIASDISVEVSKPTAYDYSPVLFSPYGNDSVYEYNMKRLSQHLYYYKGHRNELGFDEYVSKYNFNIGFDTELDIDHSLQLEKKIDPNYVYNKGVYQTLKNSQSYKSLLLGSQSQKGSAGYPSSFPFLMGGLQVPLTTLKSESPKNLAKIAGVDSFGLLTKSLSKIENLEGTIFHYTKSSKISLGKMVSTSTLRMEESPLLKNGKSAFKNANMPSPENDPEILLERRLNETDLALQSKELLDYKSLRVGDVVLSFESGEAEIGVVIKPGQSNEDFEQYTKDCLIVTSTPRFGQTVILSWGNNDVFSFCSFPQKSRILRILKSGNTDPSANLPQTRKPSELLSNSVFELDSYFANWAFVSNAATKSYNVVRRQVKEADIKAEIDAGRATTMDLSTNADKRYLGQLKAYKNGDPNDERLISLKKGMEYTVKFDADFSRKGLSTINYEFFVGTSSKDSSPIPLGKNVASLTLTASSDGYLYYSNDSNYSHFFIKFVDADSPSMITMLSHIRTDKTNGMGTPSVGMGFRISEGNNYGDISPGEQQEALALFLDQLNRSGNIKLTKAGESFVTKKGVGGNLNRGDAGNFFTVVENSETRFIDALIPVFVQYLSGAFDEIGREYFSELAVSISPKGSNSSSQIKQRIVHYNPFYYWKTRDYFHDAVLYIWYQLCRYEWWSSVLKLPPEEKLDPQELAKFPSGYEGAYDYVKDKFLFAIDPEIIDENFRILFFPHKELDGLISKEDFGKPLFRLSGVFSGSLDVDVPAFLSANVDPSYSFYFETGGSHLVKFIQAVGYHLSEAGSSSSRVDSKKYLGGAFLEVLDIASYAIPVGKFVTIGVKVLGRMGLKNSIRFAGQQLRLSISQAKNAVLSALSSSEKAVRMFAEECKKYGKFALAVGDRMAKITEATTKAVLRKLTVPGSRGLYGLIRLEKLTKLNAKLSDFAYGRFKKFASEITDPAVLRKLNESPALVDEWVRIESSLTGTARVAALDKFLESAAGRVGKSFDLAKFKNLIEQLPNGLSIRQQVFKEAGMQVLRSDAKQFDSIISNIMRNGDRGGDLTEEVVRGMMETKGYQFIPAKYNGSNGFDGLFIPKGQSIDNASEIIVMECKQFKQGVLDEFDDIMGTGYDKASGLKLNPGDNSTNLPKQMSDDWIQHVTSKLKAYEPTSTNWTKLQDVIDLDPSKIKKYVSGIDKATGDTWFLKLGSY